MYNLRDTAKAAGFAATQFWTHDFLLQEAWNMGKDVWEAFSNVWMVGRKVRLDRQRPYCASFKPIALWKAMTASREGEYVAWADASRYHNTVLRQNVRDAIAVLLGHAGGSGEGQNPKRPPHRLNTSLAWARTDWYSLRALHALPFTSRAVRSAYGLVHCPFDCTRCSYVPNNRCLTREYSWLTPVGMDTMLMYRDMIPMSLKDFGNLPHVLSSNILLENTRENRLLVWDWMWMALARPEGFCFSHVQDQAAWTVLVLNRSLPLINACMYLGRHRFHLPRPHGQGLNIKWCSEYTKNTNTFYATLGQGAFEVIAGHEHTWVVPTNQSRLNCLYANLTRAHQSIVGLPSCRRSGKRPSDNIWV